MNRTITVGRYKLVERFYRDDTVCTIYLGRQKISVYCSFSEALAHKCEWFEE